ncbi:MAG: NAD/NADP octopine/nopaline dehydrogenase, partial [Acidimicrobiia bacterium]|nr:NAD/NADP octopine/nopaline dehydrogenase [Acidimicrobiia bacterium]
LTEDVPIGLNIYSQLGRSLGLEPRLMESVITLAGALLGQNFAAEGRSLESCGIAGLDREALLEYVHTGQRE